jgi:hypothetical protein
LPFFVSIYAHKKGILSIAETCVGSWSCGTVFPLKDNLDLDAGADLDGLGLERDALLLTDTAHVGPHGGSTHGLVHDWRSARAVVDLDNTEVSGTASIDGGGIIAGLGKRILDGTGANRGRECEGRLLGSAPVEAVDIDSVFALMN